MDVRARCYGIAYDYLKRNLPSAESAIMLAPGIADAFAPTITKLVEAATNLQRRLDQHFGGPYKSQDWKEQAELRKALDELEKP